MRRILEGSLLVALLLFARQASADPIAIGDLLRFQGSTGSLGGGAFLIDNTSNGAGFDFMTFCVQMNQHVSYSETFRVGSITNYADDAGGNDSISMATAWVFSSFRAGILTGFSGDEIQAAIWRLEDEWTTNVGNSAGLMSLAQGYVDAGWVNTNVRVLNLFYMDGRQAQDQLALYQSVSQLPPEQPTPEPAALALIGMGCVTLVGGRYRHRLRRPFSRAPVSTV